MLSLEEIRKFYPPELHRFDRFLLREYLQYKILEIVYESPYASKLCFIGGTCLRIVHNNNRFSEDLDFDNFDLTKEEFEGIADQIERRLKQDGFEVQIKKVHKGAYHCYVRFPNLLFESGLSGHQEEKILIRLDTEAQHFEFKPEKYIIDKFGVFTSILTTPIDILLSQKLLTITQRPRPKGRDFFDVTFLIPLTQPNFSFIEEKMGITDPEELKFRVLEKCKSIDFEEMVKDVRSFLFKTEDEKRVRLFVPYFEQIHFSF
jgi:predicted nucleotidyltransferase component of viral defense system